MSRVSVASANAEVATHQGLQSGKTAPFRPVAVSHVKRERMAASVIYVRGRPTNGTCENSGRQHGLRASERQRYAAEEGENAYQRIRKLQQSRGLKQQQSRPFRAFEMVDKMQSGNDVALRDSTMNDAKETIDRHYEPVDQE